MSDNPTTKCIGSDPYCPCQDGDACHYRDIPGSPGWSVLEVKTGQNERDIGSVREYLDGQFHDADCFATSCLVLLVQQAFERIVKEQTP